MICSYSEIYDGVEARQGLDIGRIDALIFDVDGVLIDVSRSFRRAVAATVKFYLERILGWPEGEWIKTEDTELFKKAGGFNDDWDLTSAAVLFFLCKEALSAGRDALLLRESAPTLADYTAAIMKSPLEGVEAAWSWAAAALGSSGAALVRETWRREEIARIFQEIYAGIDLCLEVYGFVPRYIGEPGLLHSEAPILRPELLGGTGRPLGIITGRTRGEMKAGLALLGVKDDFPPGRILTIEDGKKPDPSTLSVMTGRVDCHLPIYIGDTYDDLRTVTNYRSAGGEALFGAVLTGPAGEKNRSFFRSEKADIIAVDVNALLSMMKEVSPHGEKR